MDWSYFAVKYCITVSNSPRIPVIKKHLHSIGMHDVQIIEFPKAGNRNVDHTDLSETKLMNIIKHNPDVLGDVAKSLTHHHMYLIQKAYYTNINSVILLEDDAQFDQILIKKKLPSIVKWLKKEKWHIFNFGTLSIFPAKIPIHNGVALGIKPLLSHSYALSRTGMRRILDYWENGGKIMHVDKLLTTVFKKYHVAYPSICFQTEKPALFQQAETLLPTILKKYVQKNNTFASFCKNYESNVQITCICTLLILALIVYLITKKHFHVKPNLCLP